MKQELKTTDKAFYTSCTRPLFTEDYDAYKIKIKADEGEFIQVTAIRADNEKVSGTGSVSEGGYSEYTLSKDMYSVPGKLILLVSSVSGKSCITLRQIECEVKEG